MNIDLYPDEAGLRILARNKYDEACEMVSTPGDGIYEYVLKTGRLNTSYIVYWLTNPPGGKALSKDRREFLQFLNRADDHRVPRRVTRPKGWKSQAGLSTGEMPHKPLRPGDVVVHGDVATITATL